MNNELNSESSEEQHNMVKLIQRFSKVVNNSGPGFFDQEELEDLFDYFFSIGDLEKSDQVLELASAQNPFSSSFHIRKAQLWLQKGDHKKAMEMLDQAEILEASNFEIFLIRGAIQDSLGHAASAKENYIIALSYSDVENKDIIYSNLTNLLINQLNYKDAIFYLHRWMNEFPENETAVEDLSFCYAELGEFEEGKRCMDKIIDRSPYNLSAWINLSIFCNSLNQLDAAFRAIGFALAIDEQNIQSLLIKAEVLLKQAGHTQAKLCFAEVLKLDRANTQAMCGLGQCYDFEQQFELAKRWYFEALENEHQLDTAWYGLGLCELKQGNWEAAVYYCEKASSLKPDESDYWFSLGECYFGLVQAEQALGAYDHCLQLKSEHMEARLRMSRIYYDQSEWADMFALLEKGLLIHINDPEYLYHYAGFLIETECESLLEKGIEQLERAYDIYPEKVEFLKKHHPLAWSSKYTQQILRRA